jgi:tripartite-type tricarboxylate transporter receptor subunit TctC
MSGPLGHIEIIAGTPPGGGQDRTARALASAIGEGIDVRNVPGRGGGNGWDYLATRSGATDVVAVSSPTLITNSLVGESTIDDRDLTPIAVLYTEYSAVVASAGTRWADPVVTFDALARGTLTVSFATALGNMNHLVLAELSSGLGGTVGTLDLRVFESARDAVADVLGNNSEIAIVSAASAVPELGTGTLTALAVSSPERLGGVFSAVPTATELGLPCVRGTWRGLVGPPGLDENRLGDWEDALSSVTASEDWKKSIAGSLWLDTFLGASQTREFFGSERKELATLLASIAMLEVTRDG